VYVARILIQQVGATKTRIQIPLLNDRDSAAATTSARVAGCTSACNNTYAQPIANTNCWTLWRYDAANWSSIAPGTPMSFRAMLSTTAGGTAVASLFDSAGNQVTASEVSTTATSATLVTSDFALSALNDGSTYEVKIENTDGDHAVNLYKAALWIALDPLSRAESYYRVSGVRRSSAAETRSYQRVLYEAGRFSAPVTYAEFTGRYTSSGTRVVGLYDAGTADAGTEGGLFANGGVNYTWTTRSRFRVPLPASVPDGDRLIYGADAGSGRMATTTAFLVVQSSGAAVTPAQPAAPTATPQ